MSLPRVSLQRVLIALIAVALAAIAASGAQRAGLWGRRPVAPPPAIGRGATRPGPNDTAQQITALQNYLRSRPNDGNAYGRLGQLYLQRARETGDPAYYPLAEGVYQQALARNSEDVTALAGLGALALARHQFAEALDWGERARARAPEAAATYGIIADAQIELGRYPEAVATIQQMVDLRPSLNSYARVSYARELYGQVPAAIEAMERAVAAGGPGQEGTAWVLVQLGHLRFNSGDLAGADEAYRRALNEWPDYLHALAGQGRVAAARGQFDQAIAFYRRATATIPLPEYVIALGQVYLTAGQPAAAEEQFALARVQARLFIASGMNSALELALFAADFPGPGDDPARTVAQARVALAARPSIYGYDTLAWALYRAGQYDEAQREIDAAMKLGTQDALLYFHAGMIAQARGDTALARQHLATALRINPYFSLIHAPTARAVLGQ